MKSILSNSGIFYQEGDSPILFIAPHGVMGDDDHTDYIAKFLATKLDAFAVVNTGWNRSDKPDISQRKANLNSVEHCLAIQDIRHEFLDRIEISVQKILQSFHSAHLFFIHGMGNRKVNRKRVDVILGYGEGNPSSYTCPVSYKDEFGYQLIRCGFGVFQGMAGGRFSAWAKDNLCQYFRKHKFDVRVNSIQIEIANFIRGELDFAKRTSRSLYQAILQFLYHNVQIPNNFKLPLI